MKNEIKLLTIGDTGKLPLATQSQLEKTITKTKENSKLTLILALSYSGKWDILNAVKKIIENKELNENITEKIFEQYLATKNVPDPELLIRTSGEYRISNFLLWPSSRTQSRNLCIRCSLQPVGQRLMEHLTFDQYFHLLLGEYF